MTHTMGRGGKRTLSDFNFGKPTAAQSRRREKPQAMVKVLRFDKERPRWGVRALADGIAAILPGDFTSWQIAEQIAVRLADAYRRSGYDVALDTTTCKKRQKSGTEIVG